jgi:hypothetical protein
VWVCACPYVLAAPFGGYIVRYVHGRALMVSRRRRVGQLACAISTCQIIWIIRAQSETMLILRQDGAISCDDFGYRPKKRGPPRPGHEEKSFGTSPCVRGSIASPIGVWRLKQCQRQRVGCARCRTRHSRPRGNALGCGVEATGGGIPQSTERTATP